MARALLVDDDPAILRLLEVTFGLEGFETVTASRGEDAVIAAAEHRPDAVVLDLMLPGLDGREVLRRIREDPATASIPVVFLTARTADETRSLDAPFLTKPFDPSELIELVRAQLGGTA